MQLLLIDGNILKKTFNTDFGMNQHNHLNLFFNFILIGKDNTCQLLFAFAKDLCLAVDKKDRV
jgi:hypothetical protein